MKLVASLIVRNELGRYLEPCIAHLAEFCDEIVMLDDGSDGALDPYLGKFGDAAKKVYLFRDGDDSAFFAHEGRARQRLLDLTMIREPTHILAIDADEFVGSGPELRRWVEGHQASPLHRLCMEEVWSADAESLGIRTDGGWRYHWVPSLFAVPRRPDRDWRILDRALACGREPVTVRRLDQARQGTDTGISLLHLGWANRSERFDRHARYAKHDGGRFHASAHLQSILWPDAKIKIEHREWPAGLGVYAAAIVARASSE